MSKSAIIALRMKEISLDLISAFKNRKNCISCTAPCGITANIKNLPGICLLSSKLSTKRKERGNFRRKGVGGLKYLRF